MSGKLNIFRIALTLLFAIVVSTASAQTINGNVKDTNGEAVIGATVTEEGTKNATVTDFDGNFTLKLTGKKAIVVSFIGMKNKTVSVAGKQSVNVVLEEDAATLNEVVVVGYGTMKKSDLTGSVGSISSENLVSKGATSVMESMQGSVPGVSITQSSSRAGGSFDIEIRGKSTMGDNTTPLFVIDGVICSSMDFLNPQDIEKIDILKDASSTAIYGSRATNGVVMITTKGGNSQAKKVSKPTISYDGYYGVKEATRMPDFMTGSQFMNWRYLRYLNTSEVEGDPGKLAYTMTPGNYDTTWLAWEDGSGYALKDTQEFDWKDAVMRTATQQNHFVSISGGGENINYHFGVGYQQEEGIYKNDGMNRYNIKGSIDAKINKYFSAGINFNGAVTDINTVNDNSIKNAFMFNPLTVPYNADGSLAKTPGNNYYKTDSDGNTIGTANGANFTNTVNPLLDFENSEYSTKKYNFLGNLYLEVHPMDGLTFKTTFSPNFSSTRYGTWEDSETAAQNFVSSYASITNTSTFDWTWDNMLTYIKTFGDHSINAMGLFSANKYQKETSYLDGYSVADGTKWWNLDQSTGTQTIKSGYTEYSMLSYAFRLNYTYKGKYMFTGTVRSDGSSRFADGHRWGSFPSMALAWRIGEESWMKKIDWLSNLKLRASFGVTGNNSVGDYATQTSVTGGHYYGFANGTGNEGYRPSGIVNTLLTWEKTTEYNVGLDFGFLNNRISGSIDWYHKTSKDLLMDMQLPYEVGGTTITTNNGKVRNTGVEVTLKTVNVVTKDWYWETSFAFSHNKNKILEVNGGTEDDIENNRFIGESINALYTYSWDGIVSDKLMTIPNNKAGQEFAAANGMSVGDQVKEYTYYNGVYGWYEGMPIIRDVDGDGVIDDNDKFIVGKSDPSWTGSFNTTLTYKNWDFSASIYTKQNYKVFSPFYEKYTQYSLRGTSNIDMDFYIPAGTMISCDGFDADGNAINPVYQETTHYGSYPMPSNAGSLTNTGVGNYAFGTDGKNNVSKKCPATVVDGSYWKVKNIAIGYTFDKNLLSHVGIQSLRLYFNVTNPFVFGTNYKGFDPEWCGSSLSDGGPSTITYQFGVNLKF